MEAMSLGIPVLTPLKNSNIPILVTKENFQELSRTNFSERNTISAEKQNEAYDKLITSLNDESYYAGISYEVEDLFERFLNVEKALDKYEVVYQNSLNNGLYLKGTIVNKLYLLKILKSLFCAKR